MDVQVTPIDRLLTIHKSAVMSTFLHFAHGRYRTVRSWDWEWVRMVKWNSPFWSDRSNQQKWSTSKGGLIFLKLFRLVQTDPFSFWPKFAKILIEWIAPVTWKIWAASNLSQQHPTCRNRVAKCTQHVVPSNVAIYVALKCCDRLAGVLEVRNEVNINCFKQLLKTS